MISQTSYNYKANMLGICVISLCLGIILHKLGPERTESIRKLLREGDSIVQYVMQQLMR